MNLFQGTAVTRDDERMVRASTIPIIIAWVAFMAGLALGMANPNAAPIPCHEDQVYAVQVDTNPAHGLTWACEAR